MSGRGDAAPRLERALAADAARNGVALTIESHRSTRWASATFVGARHRLELHLQDGAASWLDALPEADLPIRGHLVADLIVLARVGDDRDVRATIEVLTVEDA